MKNKQTTGLLLIFILFIIYFYFFSSKSLVQDNINKKINFNKDFLVSYKEIFNKLSNINFINFKYNNIFKNIVHGKEKNIIIENQNIKVILSSKGGMIKKVILKQYNSYNNNSLILLDSKSSEIGLKFFFNDFYLYTNNLFFKTDVIKNVSTNSVNKVIFTLNINSNSYIQQIFSLCLNSKYSVKYQVKIFGLNDYLIRDQINFV